MERRIDVDSLVLLPDTVHRHAEQVRDVALDPFHFRGVSYQAYPAV